MSCYEYSIRKNAYCNSQGPTSLTRTLKAGLSEAHSLWSVDRKVDFWETVVSKIMAPISF